jgi:hypothetical protein
VAERRGSSLSPPETEAPLLLTFMAVRREKKLEEFCWGSRGVSHLIRVQFCLDPESLCDRHVLLFVHQKLRKHLFCQAARWCLASERCKAFHLMVFSKACLKHLH